MGGDCELRRGCARRRWCDDHVSRKRRLDARLHRAAAVVEPVIVEFLRLIDDSQQLAFIVTRDERVDLAGRGHKRRRAALAGARVVSVERAAVMLFPRDEPQREIVRREAQGRHVSA